MSLTNDQIQSFHEKGFVGCGRVLDDEELNLLRDEYDAVFARAREDGSYNNLAGAGAKDAKGEEMLQIMQMCERSLAFRRLLFHEKILDLVESIIGPNILLFHDQALFKPASQGGPVFWHQDNAYWRCSPANLVSCWLTLDNVRRENGAMQLIPGSHLRIANHARSTESKALLDSGSEVDASLAEVVELPAGGCMVHHCQTLHMTEPNATADQRRALAIHYMPPGTRSAAGEVISAGWSHPALRLKM